MIKINVGGKDYEVQFRYTRITTQPGVKIPSDTHAELNTGPDTPVLATGMAKLHWKDRNKFQKPMGRKIALQEIASQMNWSYQERAEFWNQVLPLVRKNG